MRSALLFSVAATLAAVACHKLESHPPELDHQPVPPPNGGGGGVTDAGTDASGDGGSASCVEPPGVSTSFAPKRVLYVAPDGSDANDGGSRATAWRSLANAAQLAPGDRVDVSAGTYPCGAVISVQATAAAPVWIRSVDGNGKAIFDCGGSAVGLAVTSASYVVIQGIDLSGSQQAGIQIGAGPAPNFANPSDHVVLLDNRVHNVGGPGISVGQSTHVEVLRNAVDTTAAMGPAIGTFGIGFAGVDGGRIVGNVVQNVTGDAAVRVAAGTRGVTVAANVVKDSDEAIDLGGASDRSLFQPADATYEASGIVAHSNVITGLVGIALHLRGCASCLVANNTMVLRTATEPIRAVAGNTGLSAGSAQSHSTGLRLVNNLLYLQTRAPTNVLSIAAGEQTDLEQSHDLFFFDGGNVGALPSTLPMAGTGTILDRDPRFVDRTGGDYALAAGSPARDAGTALAQVLYDATGACRTRWNIGAF